MRSPRIAALVVSVWLAACGSGSTPTSLVFVADVVAAADQLPTGDPESRCTGTVTLTIDPTLKGALKLASARFDIKLNSCAGDTVITDVHVHRGSESNLAIDASMAPLTLTNGGGSGTATNPAVKPAAVDDIAAGTVGFYINLHSKRHPNGFMRGDLRRG